MPESYFAWFWSAMIFASIAWYSLLLFLVGIRGGWDIVRMIGALTGERPKAPGSDGP